MKTTPIKILLLFVFFLLAISTASHGNRTSRNFTYRFVHHHPYYVTPPHRSCDSFSRPYARSMCIELQRIHRKHPPLLSPPPPLAPAEIDPRYGVDKRLVPSGPNPLHN